LKTNKLVSSEKLSACPFKEFGIDFTASEILKRGFSWIAIPIGTSRYVNKTKNEDHICRHKRPSVRSLQR